MTRVDIVSGFLGAGKTTLIKKLLKEAFVGEQVVLIENEFGEIGIDGGFLKEAGVQITEMNSGCICCSLVGDFGDALQKVVTEYHPDRILIEPSGVGKLSDVAKAVLNVQDKVEGLKLGSLVTVADAHKCKMYMKNFGEFYNNQIESAAAIILSRTGDMDQAKIEAVVALLQEKNAEARIVTTPWEAISGKQILDAIEGTASLAEELMEHLHEEEDEDEEHDEHEHHHDHCCHHHHDEDEEEHECCHHHHHDEDDDDDDDEDEHEHHHEHCHHHDHEDEDHDHDEDEHDEHCHCGCHHHHHHGHDADEVFTSWGKETPKLFDEDDLKMILDKLANDNEYGIILRAKGIVKLTDGNWAHFDLVPGETEIRHGAADYTGRLCVIGSQLQEEKLAELFEL